MALQRASNTAMHQTNPPQTHDHKMVKKFPRYLENTMVKTQGPTLLRTIKNSLVFHKTRWLKPMDQHYYALEKNPLFHIKHDGENPRTNTTTI